MSNVVTGGSTVRTLPKRLGALHSAAVRVAGLGYGCLDRAVLYGAYVLMPIKSRLPLLAERLIGVRIHHVDGPAKIWFSDRSELIVLEEVMLDSEYNAVETREAVTIIDLGANIGISVLWFRAKYPNALIIAVEPDPRTFSKLTRNTGADLKVRRVRAAITDRSRPVSLVSHRLSWASHVDERTAADSPTVDGLRLDDLCEMNLVGEIDILKMDIEGMEWQVLRSADCLRRTSEVIGEMHPDGAPEDIEAFFDAIERWSGLRRVPAPGRLFRLQRAQR